MGAPDFSDVPRAPNRATGAVNHEGRAFRVRAKTCAIRSRPG